MSDKPIRSTAIKAARIDDGVVSMAHMHLSMTESRDDTPAMRTGRLFHMAILEPVKLAELPRWTGYETKSGAVSFDKRGAAWTEFAASLQDGEDYVSAAELDTLQTVSMAAARRLRGLPAIASVETQIDWIDPVYGAGTARIDAILSGGAALDVKTCRDIGTRRFTMQSYSLGYHVQFGWYDHGLRENGMTGQRYVLAIENHKPYATAIYQMHDELLKNGYEEAEQIARHYRACEATGHFPGPYDDGIMPYEVPAWAQEDEQDISNGETMEASEL